MNTNRGGPALLITATIAAFAIAQNGTQEMRLLRFPNVHANQILFTYASDLWTADLNGGIARRLTTHPNLESRARYSPDGSMIAFTASYDGTNEVYVMPADGGNPQRLTYGTTSQNVVGWTPDGKIAFISQTGSNFGQLPRLYLINPKGGLPEPTPVLEAADVSFSPDGSKVAYHRMPSNNFNWRHYRGGTQGRISIFDLKNNTYSELPSGREQSYSPMWIGNTIYYVSDKELNTVNLWRYDLGSKSAKRLTDFTMGDIKWPSSDGKNIVFERDGYLYDYDTKSNDLKKLSPRVLSDDILARPTLKKLANYISNATISPSGVRVAVEARGELFSLPVKQGDTRNLTNTPDSRERFPNWSPDGQTIAYASDAGGTWQLYSQPQLGGAPTKLTTLPSTSFSAIGWSNDSKKIAFATRNYELSILDVASKAVTAIDKDELGTITAFDWSPDSKWIAYIKNGKNMFGAAYLYNVAENKKTQITEGYFRDDTITFDLNGKYLYVISARDVDPTPRGDEFDVTTASLRQRVYMIVLDAGQENPLMTGNDEEPSAPLVTNPGAPPAGTPAKPEGAQAGGNKTVSDIKVDIDELGNRIVALPMPQGSYWFVVGAKNGVLIGTESGISKFDVDSKESTPVFSGQISGASFNGPRTKMVYQSGPRFGVVDLKPGAKAGDGPIDTSDVSAVIDMRKEWNQIFWDTWRWERDNYYDPNMRGLDWKAIGDHYAAFLPYVGHRNDLTYILGLMIGELGTSHTYTGGGDQGTGAPGVAVGHLGADYSAENGKIRIKRIYRGSSFTEGRRGPLGDPGVNVKEGDYLLAIDGKSLDASTHPGSLMIDKPGKYVTLTVNSSPSSEGARKVRVRPIAIETELRYATWIEGNRRMVEKLSGGRVGYVHVPNTSTQGAVEFVKGYYANIDKDALVVDERFNGGGSIPTPWIDILSRSYQTFFEGRHGADIGFPVRSIDGPKCMLINNYAGSGGDMFPYLFRRQKIGPLIGTRTWGGLVGYNEQYALADGGWVTAPEAAFYEATTGEWIAENKGVEPDIEVDARPDLIYKGEDPQLTAAVNYLLKQLKDHPPVKNKRPAPIPIKQ
jgi:tricorn protease